MNINELYNSIPEELHGNIAVSGNSVSITHPGGKGATVYELGAEVESAPVKDAQPTSAVVKAKEVKAVNTAALEASLGVKLRTVVEQKENV
jgi:hypothetical protein